MSQLPQLSPGSGSIMSSPRGSSLPEEQDHLHEPSIKVFTQTSLDGDCESQDAVHEKENMTQQESALLLRHDDGFASDVPLAVDTASGKPGATPSSSSCAHIGNMEELGQTAVVARLAALLQLGQTSVVGCGKRARQEDKSVHSGERVPSCPGVSRRGRCAARKLSRQSAGCALLYNILNSQPPGAHVTRWVVYRAATAVVTLPRRRARSAGCPSWRKCARHCGPTRPPTAAAAR